MALKPNVKSGVYYGTRAVPGGFGIWVIVFRGGSLETEDLNTTPWLLSNGITRD